MKTIRGILQILLSLVILLPAAVYFMINVPEIQTYLVNKITNAVSEKTGTRVSVKSVNYKFFKNLVVEGVFIEDTQGDTLFSISKVEAKLSKIWFSGEKIDLSNISLYNGQFNLITTNDTTNLDRLLARLASRGKTEESGKSEFSVSTKKLCLNNFKFVLKNNDVTTFIPATQINFSDLAADSINLIADNIRLLGDSVFFRIENLSLKEKSGFRINKFSTDDESYFCPRKLYLPGLKIVDDYTRLTFGYFSMIYPNGDSDFGKFETNVKFDADITEGYVAFKTIGFFAGDLMGNRVVIAPRGKIVGSVSNLKLYDFQVLSYTGNTNIMGNFSVIGLPDIDKTIFSCENLYVNSSINDLDATLQQILSENKKLLKVFAPLQYIRIFGKIEGKFNNFNFDGNLLTKLGTATANAKFDFSESANDFEIIGGVELYKFNLGKMLNSDDIKETSLKIEMRGLQPHKGEFSMYAEGVISEFGLGDNIFKNIDIAGTLFQNAFDGKILSKDKNLKFDFLGRVDMDKTESDDYRANFTANIFHANLFKLGLKADSTAVFSGKIIADIRGKDFNMGGNLTLQNAKYTDAIGCIDIGNIQGFAQQSKNNYKITLRSGIFDATYIGNENIGYFVKNMKSIAAKYIPNLGDSGQTDINAKYKLTVKLKKVGKIARIISPGMFIASNSTLDTHVENGKADVEIKSDLLYIGKNIFKGLDIKGSGDSTFSAQVKCNDLTFAGFNFKGLKMQNKIHGNTISSNIKFDDKAEKATKADLNIDAKIIKKSGEDNYFSFVIKPSQFTIDGSTWDLSCNSINLDSDLLTINKFMAISQSQKILINGQYSPKTNDTVKFDISGFEASNFNKFLKNEGYNLSGTISGKAQITNIMGKPLFFANIKTTDIKANDFLLGKIFVNSVWDNENKKLDFTTRIEKENFNRLKVFGSYTPSTEFFDFTFDVDKFEIKAASPLLAGVLNDIDGTMSGKIQLSGKGGQLNLLGAANLENAAFTVDFLKTRYSISTPIIFSEDKIRIINAKMYDADKNSGTINATALHKNLKGFTFNVAVNSNNLMGLNTTEKDNEQFYGKAYVTGQIKMIGGLDDLKFNISIRPEKHTILTIPIDAVTISANSLLTFESDDEKGSKDDVEKFLEEIAQKKVDEEKTNSDLRVSLNLAMNNNAEVRLILDRQTGDAITGKGSGTLRMVIIPREEQFKLYGNYVIESGKYNLTIPSLNFITKEFLINNGSRIMFNGYMDETKVDISANYAKTFRLSLRNLLADTTASIVKYPVLCKIKLSDRLSNLTMKPDIEIQNVNIDTKARAQAALNTEDKMLKQFLSLLVLGNFTSDQQMGQGSSSSGLTSNLSEIFSNQLNNWLSMLKVPVDVGVDVRTGSSAEPEFDAYASLKLFDDRVEVSGNVGSAPRTSASDIAGDFDVDIKLNRPGSLKLKAFSHSTDEYTDNAETSRQGLKVSYQGGFNTWKELWNSIFKPKKADKPANVKRKRKQSRNR